MQGHPKLGYMPDFEPASIAPAAEPPSVEGAPSFDGFEGPAFMTGFPDRPYHVRSFSVEFQTPCLKAYEKQQQGGVCRVEREAKLHPMTQALINRSICPDCE